MRAALIEEDDRHNYGEARMLGIGYIGRRLHFVVFVEREGIRRIISLRKTNEREDRRYAQT
ncbi:MAG: BrnT family toxin [Pseudomonadota bacterium]